MGQTLKEIKARIKATQKTSQITKAMNMVSASKMKRSEKLIKKFEQYVKTLGTTMSSILNNNDTDIEEPLLQKRDVKNTLYVVVTSDRGLAGPYNSSIIKKYLSDEKNAITKPYVLTIGKKAYLYLKNSEHNLINKTYISQKDKVSFAIVKLIANEIIKLYENKTIDEVLVYYNHYINTLSQAVTVKRLMPIEVNSEAEVTKHDFEPNIETVIKKILPVYIENTIYGILLDAKASEHAARMTAMKSATDNANGIIKELELHYNRARQAAITLELTDIIGGANAVE